jgi:hypothetical protein
MAKVDHDDDNPDLDGEDLINYLEKKLEQIEKNLGESQKEYETMQNECLDIQERLGVSKEKYKRAALLMTEFLEDLLKQKPNILQEFSKDNSQEEDELDLERLNSVPFEHLSRDEKVRIVFLLLKQLQPYLSANNLTVVPNRRHMMAAGNNTMAENSIHSQTRHKSEAKNRPPIKKALGRSVDRTSFQQSQLSQG